jgi:DNA polymerase-3 subunit delta
MSERRPAGTVPLLLWGEDPFLLRNAAAEALGGIDPVVVSGGEWRGGETADLATPSLFGEERALLVLDGRSLPEAAVAELRAFLASPVAEARLVVTAVVPERGKAPAALAKLFKEAGAVRQVRVDRRDLPRWVVERARARGAQLAPDGAAALVDILGPAPAELDQAVAQLAGAFPGRRIARPDVEQQFRGLGEQRVWDLCDRMFGRDLAGSVRSLRSLLEAREEPLMILGSIAARLRELIRVRSLPGRLPPAEVAKRVGLRFDWQARRYQEQARRFAPGELVRAHAQVVEADRQLKSGGAGVADEVVLETLVVSVVGPA